MDTGEIKLPESKIHVVTKEEAEAHYKHMCNAGYDPLLCVHKTVIKAVMDYRNMKNINQPVFLEGKLVDVFEHRDVIINEPRYVDLLQMGGVLNINLDDVMILPKPDNILPLAGAVDQKIGLFWLYPSGCKTLEDLFKKYEAKIKILL